MGTLIPSGKTGDVVVWHIQPNLISGWTRPPVVGYNQVGYTPERQKIAVIELDPLYDAPKTARVLRLTPEGEYREAFSGQIKPWGKWMRYQYTHFDFSSVREPGIYLIEYAGQKTGLFRIAKDVYDGIWRPSLDTFLPKQMDHVKMREGYASGMEPRTSTTLAKRPLTTRTSTATNRDRRPTRHFLRASIFPTSMLEASCGLFFHPTQVDGSASLLILLASAALRYCTTHEIA